MEEKNKEIVCSDEIWRPFRSIIEEEEASKKAGRKVLPRPIPGTEAPLQSAWIRGMLGDPNVPPMAKVVLVVFKSVNAQQWEAVMASPSWRQDLADIIEGSDTMVVSPVEQDPCFVPGITDKGSAYWATGYRERGVPSLQEIFDAVTPSEDETPLSWNDICVLANNAHNELRACFAHTLESIKVAFPYTDWSALEVGRYDL